jgi:hypothetical protein
MNEKQIDTFLSHIKNGVSIQPACRLAGIPLVTLYAFLERGSIEEERLAVNSKLKPKKTEEGCLELWQDYSKADAEFQAKIEMSVIRAGLDGEYKASLKILEARYPAQYGAAGVKKSLREVEAEEMYELEG